MASAVSTAEFTSPVHKLRTPEAPAVADRVRIIHVEENVNMTYLHEFRECPRASRLQPGEVIVGFNTLCTMARIIDFEQGVHTYYADEGEKFDAALLVQRVRSGMRVTMVAPKSKEAPTEKRGRRKGILKAAPKRAQ